MCVQGNLVWWSPKVSPPFCPFFCLFKCLYYFGKCFVLQSTHLWIWVALQDGVATSSPPPSIGLSQQGLHVGALTHRSDSHHPQPC